MTHPYCIAHRSYFCPCVRPDSYKKGDKRGDPKTWDEAREAYLAKQAAKLRDKLDVAE